MNTQIAVNALFSASVILLMAMGFSVIFTVTRFFHFAHGIIFTSAAYFAFFFTSWMGLPLFFSLLLAIISTALLGLLIEITIYRQLRRNNSSPLVLLLASLGIYIVLQNVISIVFGDDTKSIRSGMVMEGFEILGAWITPIQVATIISSLVLLSLLVLLLKGTKLGRSMRAVANDPELADVCGINSERIILWTFCIGSTLAGIAGVLTALDVDMTPTMGMSPLMLGVVAVIIGGAGNIFGISLGALLLAFAQQFGIWHLGSQWQEMTAFAILIIFLLLKPEGFMGKKVKSASV